MVTLMATRGLPGSGKTTEALRWVIADPARRVRVGTDETLEMLHDEIPDDEDGINHAAAEFHTMVAVHGLIRSLLSADVNVICDDPNLLPRQIDALRAIANECGAAFEIIDLIHVDVETCVHRDEERGLHGGRWVGEKRIRALDDMYRSYLGSPVT